MDFGTTLLMLAGIYSLYYFYPNYKPLFTDTGSAIRDTAKWLLKVRVSVVQTIVKLFSKGYTGIKSIRNIVSNGEQGKEVKEVKWYDNYHLLVYGATGKGKSSFVDWLIYDILQRKEDAKFILINPHHKANQWGTDNVIGRGRNYADVEEALPKILKLMDERYEQYTNIEDVEFDDVYVIVDEVPAIRQSIDSKTFQSFVKQMTSEARKVHIWLVLITQSKFTKQLGFEGASDMLDNLILVRVDKPNYRYEFVDEEGKAEQINDTFEYVSGVTIAEERIYEL